MSKIKASEKDFEIAERLKEIRIALFGERGQTQMAQFLNVPQSAYFKYEHAQVRLQNKAIVLLAERKNVNPLWLLTGKGDKFLKRGKPLLIKEEEEEYRLRPCLLPLLSDEIAAGPPRAIEDYTPEDFISVHPSFVRHPKSTFVLKVKGDSMEPRIMDGDYVAVDVQAKEPENGKIFALRLENLCLIRRVFLKKESLILEPQNPAYEPSMLIKPRENPIIGKVCLIISPNP